MRPYTPMDPFFAGRLPEDNKHRELCSSYKKEKVNMKYSKKNLSLKYEFVGQKYKDPPNFHHGKENIIMYICFTQYIYTYSTQHIYI